MIVCNNCGNEVGPLHFCRFPKSGQINAPSCVPVRQLSEREIRDIVRDEMKKLGNENA